MFNRVLLADDDPLIRRVLSLALSRAGLHPVVVRDGHEALAALSQPDAPRMALLDWVMPGLDGIEVCRQLRQAGVAGHIFLVSSRQSEEDILAGFDAGVDEFIAKPFDPSVVVARLLAVKRRLEQEVSGKTQDIARLLQMASREGTGEVIVRSRTHMARVLFHQGKVAWVQLSGGTPLSLLLARLGVSEGDARLVLEECRSKKLPFKDTMVGWGLVEQEQLRRCFQEEFALRLGTVVGLSATSAFFVPGEQTFQSGFSYAIEELMPLASDGRLPAAAPVPLRPSSLPPEAQADQGVALDGLSTIEGLVGATVFDQHSGLTLQTTGEPGDRGLLHQQIRLFNFEETEPLEELMLVGATRYHLLRRLPQQRLLYLLIERALNPNIALVRLMISQWQQKNDLLL